MTVMDPEWTDKRMDDFAGRVDRFEADVDRRFDKVDKRFDRFEAHVEARFERADEVEKERFGNLEARMDARMDGIEARFDRWGKLIGGGVVTITAGVIARLFGVA